MGGDTIRAAEIEAVLKARDEMTSHLEAASGAAKGLGGSLREAADTALGFLGADAALALLHRGVALAKEAVIGLNSQQERAISVFTGLAGSAEAAKKMVMGVYEFAKSTPFEAPSLLAAMRSMELFGGATFATQKNLQMVADVAAGTGQPVEAIGSTISRLYAAIGQGQPINRFLRSLMLTGAISPAVVATLEKMQKAGKSSAEIWKYLTDNLNKFNGSAARQANDWQGLTKRLQETIMDLSAHAFKPFFDLAEMGLRGLVDWLGSTGVSGAMDAFGHSVEQAVGLASRVLGGFMGLGGRFVQWLLSLAAPEIQKVFAFLGGFAGIIGTLVSNLSAGQSPLAALTTGLAGLGLPVGLVNDLVAAASRVWGDLVALWRTIQGDVAPVLTALRPLGAALMELLGAVLPLVGKLALALLHDLLSALPGASKGAVGPLGDLLGIIKAGVDDVRKLADYFNNNKGALEALGRVIELLVLIQLANLVTTLAATAFKDAFDAATTAVQALRDAFHDLAGAEIEADAATKEQGIPIPGWLKALVAAGVALYIFNGQFRDFVNDLVHLWKDILLPTFVQSMADWFDPHSAQNFTLREWFEDRKADAFFFNRDFVQPLVAGLGAFKTQFADAWAGIFDLSHRGDVIGLQQWWEEHVRGPLLVFWNGLPADLKKGLGDVGQHIWDAFVQALIDTLPVVNMAHLVDMLVQAVKDALGIHSPSTVFYAIGLDVGNGFWNGVAYVFGGGGLVSWFRTWGAWIQGWVGYLGSTLSPAGTTLVDGFWNGMAYVFAQGGLADWFRTWGTYVQGWVGWLGGTLFRAGDDLMAGFWNGISWWWTQLSSFFIGLGEWIRDHKGPPSADAVLLYDAGRAIMAGFGRGLAEGWADVQQQVAGMGTAIPGMVTSGSRMSSQGGLGGNGSAAPGATPTRSEQLLESINAYLALIATDNVAPLTGQLAIRRQG